ncbi:MAG: hypothetical protein ABS98_00410 [Lysobacteraceae bacterium SCN 69-48]|nr:MAG: hypothetical protein ABS98_00410 [Xanthomonadaceae bacterium SCN 69-48]
MAETCPLSRPGEARLRIAFDYIKSWTIAGLLVRLQEKDIGAPSKNAAYILVSRGLSVGLLERAGKDGHLVVLNKAWEHPCGLGPIKPSTKPVPPPAPKPEPRVRANDFTLLGKMPAMRGGPLMPSLGHRAHEGVDADGELLPCIGGRIVDALHSQFQAVFAGADQ